MINKRGVLKDKLSRFGDSLYSLSVDEIRIRYEKIKRILDEFESLQEQIASLPDSNELENNLQREAYENQYFSILATEKGAIQSVEQSKIEIKLPNLQLREFNGNQKNWINFVETFKDLVHNNTALSNVQKFYYYNHA